MPSDLPPISGSIGRIVEGSSTPRLSKGAAIGGNAVCLFPKANGHLLVLMLYPRMKLPVYMSGSAAPVMSLEMNAYERCEGKQFAQDAKFFFPDLFATNFNFQIASALNV